MPEQRHDGQLDAASLQAFVAESNRIEGITEVRAGDIPAHTVFLAHPIIGIDRLEGFVHEIARAELRQKPGMDVRIGNHIPPLGGPHIYSALTTLLDDIKEGLTPYEAHLRYEALHPFMDGNGRSGRALWAWQMLQVGQDPFALPFLHRFYYQTLNASQTRRGDPNW